MPQYNLNYLCATIGNLSNIPIRVYEKDKQVFYHSLVSLPKDPATLYIDKLLAIKNHVGYFITPIFNYYGVVRSNDVTVILGPTRLTQADEKDLRELAFHLGVSTVETEDFILAMNNIVNMPLDSIMQIMFTMNHILNGGEMLGLKDINIVDSEQENLKTILEKQEIRSAEFASNSAQDAFNSTYTLEQTLMNMVSHGDTASFKKWVANAPAVRPGIVAKEPLRQMKNMFIVSTTLVSRNAILGGMDFHDAFTLSDQYIQKCEMLMTMNDITNLQYRMVLDYIERVERIRRGKTPTKLAVDVTNYVLHHLSDAIKTEDIAKALFMSRSRLSTRFKEETGTTLTDYILKEKSIEGKRLLRYSDKSIISISEYLGFSSPAHFSRVFKKYIGITPNEYREKKN